MLAHQLNRVKRQFTHISILSRPIHEEAVV
jgi:hypothetical protein